MGKHQILYSLLIFIFFINLNTVSWVFQKFLILPFLDPRLVTIIIIISMHFQLFLLAFPFFLIIFSTNLSQFVLSVPLHLFFFYYQAPTFFSNLRIFP